MRGLTVAIVGLGAMGRPLVDHLLEHGSAVLVSDIDEARVAGAVEAGAEAVGLEEVGTRADWVLLSLPGPKEAEIVVTRITRSVVAGEGRLNGLVDLTSSDPAVSRRLAESSTEQGLRYIDAGVLGNPPLARTGSLILLLGAEADEISGLEELLSSISRLWFPLGKPGSGHAAKLAANELFTAQVAAMAEALSMLDSMGTDIAVFLEALSATGGRGIGLADIGSTMIGHPPELGFALQLAAKDVRLLKELVGSLGREFPVLSGLDRLYGAAAEARPADDYTRVYQHLSDQRVAD